MLADAWLEGALALPAPFRAWAMAGTRRARPGGARDALDRGAVGLELAADLLAAPGGLDQLAPLLDVLEAAGRPLLVHPGPAGAGDAPGRPVWWAPVVPYVAQLHAAWWAWAADGRARYPRPAGLLRRARPASARCTASASAPAAATAAPVDPLTFVETSSYGPQAVDAVIRVLGIDVVCHGSDRPYADAAAARASATPRCTRSSTVNPGRLLARCPARRCPHDPRRVRRAPRARPAERPHAGAPRARAPRGRAGRAARAVAAAPRPAATERTYACLHRDAQLDVWAIFWLPENDTGWHDHDTSSGAVHVVAGALEEHALLVAAPERRTRYGARRSVHVRTVAHPPR